MGDVDLRYGSIVDEALKQYNINFVKADFFSDYTNVLYKVVGNAEEVYGLKICRDESTTLEDNLCEAFFLSLFSNADDFLVPRVILNRYGMGVTFVSSAFFETPRRTILYKWVEGKEFEKNRTDDLFYELGKSIAQLHKATDGITIPADIKPKRWDKVFYFRGEEVVFENEIYRDKFGEKGIGIYKKAISFADEHLHKMINKYPLNLLHGDINPWNVLLCNGKLGIIDFEDSILGYSAQDIAILLYYYRYHDEYKVFKKSLLSGYNSELPKARFDEFELEILMIARRLNFINYVLIIQENPWEYINTSLKRVDDFMRTYS